jgi:enterochelin esterase-like enzyme
MRISQKNHHAMALHESVLLDLLARLKSADVTYSASVGVGQIRHSRASTQSDIVVHGAAWRCCPVQSGVAPTACPESCWTTYDTTH